MPCSIVPSLMPVRESHLIPGQIESKNYYNKGTVKQLASSGTLPVTHLRDDDKQSTGKETLQPLRVTYFLLYFPRLTETFVAEEIEAIRSQNVDVRIISLLSPGSGPVQTISRQLLPCTWYAPRLLNYALWKAQCHFLRKSSRLYLRLLATLLRQPYPRQPLRLFVKRLVVFLKAVSAAHHLQGSGVELLHAHFAWLAGAASWICARLLDRPFTVTVHAYDLYSYKNDLIRLVSREASNVIVISESNRSSVAALGTCPLESIAVVHCGVNLTRFASPPERQRDRPAGGPLKILSVGSLVAKKGHSHLVAACRLLRERGLDFVCTIIGGGPEESVLREQVRACGLQCRVKLTGACTHPEIIAAYHGHDLFVLASVVASDGDRDGIPVVLMEAGVVGLPIISTDVSGIPELIRDGQTGCLLPPANPAALADAIAALAADPGLRAHLGQNVRALVEAEFNIEKSTVQLAGLFRNISQEWDRNFDAGRFSFRS